MNITGFSKKINEFSVKGYSELVPSLKYKIYEIDISTEYDFRFLQQYCLWLENEMLTKFPASWDGQTRLGENSLTSRYSFYSLFAIEEMKPLADIVRKHYDSFMDELGKDKDHSVYCQSWVNVMRQGEHIARHNHWGFEYTYLSANICVAANGTHTNYYNPISGEKYASPNRFGKLTIFPSWIQHDTDVVVDNDPRISIAMDFYTEKGFNEDIYEDKKWRWVELKSLSNA